MRFAHVYDVALLWLLSLIGKRTAQTIYKHGYDDGVQALREEMRGEIVRLYAASSTERLRGYDMGYRDAMAYLDDEEPQDDAPAERVM